MVSKNREFRKQKPQAVFFSIFLGFLAVTLISFLIVSDWRINKKRSELSSQIKDLEQEIQKQEEKNAQLKAGLADVQKESYWEGKIREQGFKKPGEEQVVVLPPQGSASEPSQQPKNLWQKFIDIFK